MNPSLQPYLDWFRQFNAEYLAQAGNDRQGYQLKVDHSLRVLENASAILESLPLTPGEAHLARVAALLHDAGRFPQMAGHGTFSDAKSGDHGLMGVRALVRGQALEGLSRREQGIVLGAVFLHNKATLPAGLPPLLGTCAKLVRDADKLDIMSLVGGYLECGIPDLGGLSGPLGTPGPEYNPEVARAVLAGRQPLVSGVRTRNDFLLLAANWIHEFYFPASLRLLRERRLFIPLITGIEPSPGIKPAMDQLWADYNRICKERSERPSSAA